MSLGQEVNDQVTLAPGLVIQGQSLGVAILDQGFDGVDGIIGYGLAKFRHGPRCSLFLNPRIGPTDLTCGKPFTFPYSDVLSFCTGTLVPAVTSCIPTVTDNAFTQGLIDAQEVGISFEPTTSLSDTNGEITFGGTDPSKFTGDITFVYVFTCCFS